MTIRLTIESIIAAACEICRCWPYDLPGERRTKSVSRARKIVAALAYRHGWSYPEIARALGRKFHGGTEYAASVADPWDVERASIIAHTTLRREYEFQQTERWSKRRRKARAA